MNRLIVFGEDWGAHPSSTQHLIKGLQHKYDIVWVNSIGLRRPRMSAADIHRLYDKGLKILRQIISKDVSGEAPFPVINPAAIPWPGNTFARKINGALVRKSLKPYLDDSDKPILWLSLPSAVDAVGRFNERAVVYYCGDDFSALAGVDNDAVSRIERELAEKAHLIIVASEVLAEKFPADKTHVLPHGVDFDLFSTPQPRPADLPVGKPVAGFYGSLAEWIDQDLICSAAERLPDWNFIIIGPVKVDPSRLTGYDNIHLLGPREHNRLPGYIQHWQVALLPFRLTEQIHACNPLKLREYLASGTPVVSTYFPALRSYEDLVAIARTPDEFIQAIEDTRDFEGRIEDGQQRVSKETWDQRAMELENLLESLLERSCPSR